MMKRWIWIILLLVLGNSSLLFAQQYHIGDIIENPDGSRGVVFYINPAGTGGWMVALNDVSPGCKWGTSSNVNTLTDFPSVNTESFFNELDGKTNTQKIRAFQNNNPTYAAGQVDYAHGWYLPSIGQIRILISSMGLIQSVLTSNNGSIPQNKYYWTSTERDASNAWAIEFKDNYNGCLSGGYFYYRKKTENAAVRAICDFVMNPVGPTYVWKENGVVIPSASGDEIQVSPNVTTSYSVEVFTGSCTVEDSLMVMVTPVKDSVASATACGSYEWEGDIYTVTGDYTNTYTSSEGCFYTVTLHLTIIDEIEVSIAADDEEICEGDSTTLYAEFTLPASYTPGDILCTDGTIVKPSAWPVAGKTAKGVVFYVDASGRHGWALGLNENQMKNWCVNQNMGNIPGLNQYDNAREAIKDFNGNRNTQLISNPSVFPVAGYCIEQGGYLPSIGQLNVLFGGLVVINNSLVKLGYAPIPDGSSWMYWSSTVNTNTKVFRIDRIGQVLPVNIKSQSNSYLARPVFDF
jgi:hypothetical protein